MVITSPEAKERERLRARERRAKLKADPVAYAAARERANERDRQRDRERGVRPMEEYRAFLRENGAKILQKNLDTTKEKRVMEKVDKGDETAGWTVVKLWCYKCNVKMLTDETYVWCGECGTEVMGLTE